MPLGYISNTFLFASQHYGDAWQVLEDNPHPTSIKTPEDYPQELAKHRRSAQKHVEKAAKKQAIEEENRRLMKDDLGQNKKKP